MITFLYIYFVLNLITGIVFYFTARNSRISNEFVDWVKSKSNESLITTFRRSIVRNIVGTLIIIILMIIFL